MFHGLKADSQCHVRRKKLDVIYELFFFLQFPLSVRNVRSPLRTSGLGSLSSPVSERASSTDPGVDSPLFQTPKVYRTVRTGSDRSYWSRGQYTADYLTVEHSSGLDLNDELIVRRHDGSLASNGSPTGSRSSSVRSSAAAYTVRPAHYDDAITGSRNADGATTHSRPVVHEISKNIYVVSTQFERPFDYSTATW